MDEFGSTAFLGFIVILVVGGVGFMLYLAFGPAGPAFVVVGAAFVGLAHLVGQIVLGIMDRVRD
jgi:hypothetical protein